MARSMERINEYVCRMTSNYKTIFTTVWTLRTPEGVVLIDAASYDHDAKENVLPFLEFAGVQKEEVKYVFITHNHTDHAGGLGGLLKELPGVTVVSRSAALAEKYPQTAFLCPEDGQMLTGELQVIAIPGHTADCAAILDKRTNTLLSGDSLQLYGIVGNEDWACNIRLTAAYFEAVEKVRGMKVSQLLTAHDYYPTGYRADGEAAVEKALDDCLEPLRLIGRRGDTLDAIQHLANYTVNRGVEGHIRISVDAEAYRQKREDSLRRYAQKKAQQVLKARRRTTLEPMNAYERHVIHATLQDMDRITTYSVGTEPNRRVVIEYVR